MDELFTLVLIVVFVVLPLLEGVLKKRRRDAPPPEAERPPEPPARRPEVPRRTPRTPEGRAAPPEAAPRPREADSGASEGMIPPDIWEELTGLPAPERSRPEAEEAPPEAPPGETPSREAPASAESRRPSGRPAPTPGPRAPLPEMGAPLPVARGEIGESGEAATLARTGGGAPAPLPPPPGRPAPRRTGGSSAARLVSDLRGGSSVDELRRAVLYREVLGPPVAFRGDPGPGELPE